MKTIRDVFGELDDFHLYVLLMDSELKANFKNQINKEYNRRNFSTDNLRLLADRYKVYQANIERVEKLAKVKK